MAALYPEDLDPKPREREWIDDLDPAGAGAANDEPDELGELGERDTAERHATPEAARPSARSKAAAADLPREARPWGLARRVLFRFGLLYFLLYALPFPFQNLWQIFGQTLNLLEVDRSAEAWEWMKPVNEFFYGVPMDASSNGWWTDLWQSTTTWLGGLSWIGLEVVHQRTGSGDTAHDLLKLLASTALAAFGALLWSVVFRRPTHYRRLGRWLHLGVRWYVAFALMGYGLIKFYAGQFSYPSLNRLLTPIGETSPMGLVWTFMGFSKPYEMWAGLGETLAGLLLLSRRTSLLGALVAIAVMSNVAMLNWFYDVPVKLYSSNLLAMSAALLIPDLGRLWRMFFANREVPRARTALTGARWLNVLLVVFGFAWIGVHLYTSHEGYMRMMEQRRRELPELYGVWKVEKHMVNGEELAASDPARWKLLGFDQRELGFVRSVGDTRLLLHVEEDLENDRLEVSPNDERLNKSDWNVERGTKMLEVPDPAPKTMADYQNTVEVERPTLVLWGPWDEADLELHLVLEVFRLERGFHMVQELPYNR